VSESTRATLTWTADTNHGDEVISAVSLTHLHDSTGEPVEYQIGQGDDGMWVPFADFREGPDGLEHLGAHDTLKAAQDACEQRERQPHKPTPTAGL
jgi:hypothetical protein